MILVSSCLLGIHSKYDGSLSNINNLLMKYVGTGKFLPICPEQIGGLSTPRFPSETIGGTGEDVINNNASVINDHGQDVTDEFVKGAEQVLYMAQHMSVTSAILKERSPSCGSHKVYDGNFNGTVKDGMGVTCALLKQNGIPVYSEEEVTEELLERLLKE